jgi:hypothetical protein
MSKDDMLPRKTKHHNPSIRGAVMPKPLVAPFHIQTKNVVVLPTIGILGLARKNTTMYGFILNLMMRIKG